MFILLTIKDENDQGMDDSDGYLFSKFHSDIFKSNENSVNSYDQFARSLWLNASAFHPPLCGI